MDYFERLEEAREWDRYLCEPEPEDFDAFGLPTLEAVRAGVFDYAAEVGIDPADPEEGASIGRAVEAAVASLGNARASLEDLRARAVLHAQPKDRKSVKRIANAGAHVLSLEDYPAFLEALATGQIRRLGERAQARSDELFERGAYDHPDLERLAALMGVCGAALHALATRNPERIRKAEVALRRASRTRSQTRTRAYSRPRRRGPCSQPSRHLSQAVRRTHAPPPMRGGNTVEGSA